MAQVRKSNKYFEIQGSLPRNQGLKFILRHLSQKLSFHSLLALFKETKGRVDETEIAHYSSKWKIMKLKKIQIKSFKKIIKQKLKLINKKRKKIIKI